MLNGCARSILCLKKIDERVLPVITGTMNRVHIFYNAQMLKHEVPAGFPERPERLIAVTSALTTSGVWSSCQTSSITPISDDVLVKRYGAEEVNRWKGMVSQASDAKDILPDDECLDIYWSSGSLEAISTAANAAISAVKTVLSAKQVEHAFCVIRPPGHHCFQMPAGFCAVNNIALAAQDALDMGKRVAIIDWDYHFGDGTAQTFLENPNVMFCSLHCAKNRRGHITYPKSPLKGDALSRTTHGRMFNIQWEKDDANDAAYAYAFQTAILPALRSFSPDIILVSAGYDALKGDDLAGMELTPPIFRRLAQSLVSLNIPVVCVMEGGYNTELLAQGVLETVRGLLDGGDDLSSLAETVGSRHKTIVDSAR